MKSIWIFTYNLLEFLSLKNFCHCLYSVLIISLELMIEKMRVKAKLKKYNLACSNSLVPFIDLTCDFLFKIKLLWKKYCLHIFPKWCSLDSLCLYLWCSFTHPLFRESSSSSHHSESQDCPWAYTGLAPSFSSSMTISCLRETIWRAQIYKLKYSCTYFR